MQLQGGNHCIKKSNRADAKKKKKKRKEKKRKEKKILQAAEVSK